MNINSQRLYKSSFVRQIQRTGTGNISCRFAGLYNFIIKDISNFGKSLTEIGFPQNLQRQRKRIIAFINNENYAVLLPGRYKNYKYISAIQ